MKYTVKFQYPLYLDIEVEADTIQEARSKAADIADKTPLTEWADWGVPEVFETEWIDEDGIHTII